MKRLLLIILFALLAFYIAWPAISAWQIHGAIEAEDPARLATKVDFPSVRESMRPAVERKITEKIEELKSGGGSTAAIVAGLVRGGLLENVTTVVLQSIVTPENMIRLVREPGTLPEKIDRIVKRQMGSAGIGQPAGRLGSGSGAVGSIVKNLNTASGVRDVVKTIGGDKAEGKTGSVKNREGGSGAPRLGLANIKSFGFAGPFAFDIGLARDASAAAPDLTARMEFKEFDWKLSRVVPHLK